MPQFQKIRKQDEKLFREDVFYFIYTQIIKKHNEKKQIINLQNTIEKQRINFYDFYLDVPKILLKLRKLYKLIVITNGPLYSQIPKVEKVQLSNYVDDIIIGGNYKEQKPYPSIFELALKKHKLLREETIHIGDSLRTDILGANNSNIKSIWIQNSQSELKSIKPTWKLTEFKEVPTLINENYND